MFYESRRSEPRLGGRWGAVAKAFYAGELRRAHDAAAGLEPGKDPEVLLLRLDLHRAAGREDLYQQLIEAEGPGASDPRVQLMWVRALCQRARVLAALRRLDELEPELDHEWSPLARSLRVSALAQISRERPARELLDECSEGADPFVDYELAYALLTLRDWAAALERFARVREACPRWARPWVFSYRCLSALARHEEARERLDQARALLPEDEMLAVIELGELYARKDMGTLLARLDERVAQPIFAVDEELGERIRLAERGLRVRALWGAGRREEAIEGAQALDEDYAARWEAARAEPGAAGEAGQLDEAPEPLAPRLRSAAAGEAGRSLAVQPLVQHKNMCVATSVAMLLRHAGVAADPAELYREMGGSVGVANWQLDRWLEQ
ncbi:MAG TPA: hypothetical protein DEA08_03690, partial [Planctomycetes bacterium]|nr:hypothetical protein [Planctomycetota bacterium]